MKIPDNKCLQSRVWKCCSILAWCASSRYCCIAYISVASIWTVGYKASCHSNSISHCSSSSHHLFPQVLQRPLWTCLCQISITGPWFQALQIPVFISIDVIEAFCLSIFNVLTCLISFQFAGSRHLNRRWLLLLILTVHSVEALAQNILG